jgi:hypothetical protein
MSTDPISGGITLAEDAADLLVEAIRPVVLAWVQQGQTEALQELAKVIASPEALRALDEAVVVAQRAKAERVLGG